MIKIEHIHTCNWEAAIRGMRNPLNSWNKSDSGMSNDNYILGPNDLKLAKQLATAGSDHGKFLRQIIFSCDITAPMYWWKEMDTYKVGTVRNSCSTMHKIMSKPITKEDFSWENINQNYFSANRIIGELGYMRDLYYKYKDKDKEKAKEIWYNLIKLLPSSYNQRSTWTANYEVLRNIYHARKNHKLNEWHEFCDMIEKLPFSELITEERK